MSIINNHTKELLDLIKQASYRHQTWQVFSDFVEMSAIAISNSVDWLQRDEREKKYLDIIGHYNKKEQELFPQMFGCLVDALEYELEISGPGDILGKVFHELELHNKWKGQFFTPMPVCEMMGEMALDERLIKQTIKEKGYVTLSEPACGSGAMVLGFAEAMRKRNLNYCKNLVVTAVDIDLKCVHMAYLQLSLYGIPAVVIHGNTLTVEEWSRWYTPVYVIDGWIRKQECGMTEKEEPIAEVAATTEAAEYEQLSMF